MTTKKIISNVFCIIFALIMLWFLASWIDVLMHNDPVHGDYAYAPWNFFMRVLKPLIEWRLSM